MEQSRDMKKCSNCDRPFSEDRIQLHQSYCCRNFRKCELCGSMIDRNYIEDHHNQAHRSETCPHCGISYEASLQEAHEIVCKEKPEKCIYCENLYPASVLKHHKEGCGARTRNCVICNKIVPLREMDGHLTRCAERRQRRENSQNQRQVPRQRPNLYRQNSSNNIPLHHFQQKSTKQIPIPKPRNIKPENIIKAEKVSQMIDPIPLSVKLAMQGKESNRYRGQ